MAETDVVEDTAVEEASASAVSEGEQAAPEGDSAPEESAAPPPEPEAPKAEPQHFSATIEDQKLRDFASRFNTPQEMAKSAMDLRAQLSKAPPSPPGKDATPEEVAEYERKIGIPEKYEWTKPEGRDFTEEESARQEEVAKRLKDARFTADQQKVIDSLWTEMQAEGMQKLKEQQEKATEEAAAALKKEWAGDFDANARVAATAWKRFGGSEDLENLKLEGGGRVGDHPAMMKMFAQIGRQIMESPGIDGMPTDEANDLKQQHVDAVRKSTEALDRGDRDEAKRWAARGDEIAKKLYPGKAA